jgi:uncharacterized repeat protein (TIGR01451 family)
MFGKITNNIPGSKSKIVVYLLVSILVLLIMVRSMAAEVADVERVSLGTGSVQGDKDSFYISLSSDANIVAFESFNTNWWADQTDINFVDIFIRDRTTDQTRKISVSPSGSPADQRSFDPKVSADGRYVSFISYATNLVPHDTNRHDYVDDGLDVFLYDRMTGILQRVTLDWEGEQIDANNVGFISPNAAYVVFVSPGDEVVQGDINSRRKSALYKRNLQTGAIERISKGVSGEFPNATVVGPAASYDGRYIVYVADATNLVAGDTNGQRDVFLYDSVTQQTELISKPVSGGQSNGLSSRAVISADGRYIAFHSFATNLVPGDTNGQADIFVYDRLSGQLEIVSQSSSEVLSNGESKEPGICGNGRYVIFTSEATNLVSIPHNGQRQVYVRDRQLGETYLATVNTGGGMSNGRGHRGTLSADCKMVGISTEASDMIPNDTNGARDLFVGRIKIPADLSASSMTARGSFEPGQTITYTITLRNSGTEAAAAALTIPIPADTTYVLSSLAVVGGSYNGVLNRIEWNGNVSGEGELSFTYAVVIDAGVPDFTLITNEASLSGDGQIHTLESVGMVNGLKTYFPLVAKN